MRDVGKDKPGIYVDDPMRLDLPLLECKREIEWRTTTRSIKKDVDAPASGEEETPARQVLRWNWGVVSVFLQTGVSVFSSYFFLLFRMKTMLY